jgi:hypothetical protein
VDYPGNHFVPVDPSDHYTFAGEIPWSSHFASGLEQEKSPNLYEDTVGGYALPSVAVETLAHEYAWESYHSKVNRAGNNLVPSRDLSRALCLRRIPPHFHHIDSAQQIASLTFSIPGNFGNTHILYLRKDLLLQYATLREKEFLWFAWGERNILDPNTHRNRAINEVYENRENIWRQSRKLADII